MRVRIAEGVEQTRDHWRWRPGWRPGRRMYTLHLTMEQAPAVHELAAAARRALAGCALLDPVPPEGLHLTMTGLGFTDEVPDAGLAEVSERVYEDWAGLGPVELVFNSVLVTHESVMLTTEPAAWLDVLVDLQRGAVDEVLGARQWGGFWPHLSLAYCNGVMPARSLETPLSDALEGLPDRVRATPTLTLMRLGRDTHVYRWDVLRQA